ncbi:(2,3-dihydroxybenzoyl)adenylate synthase [Aeromonas sp. 601027]|uniref:(2,3-dihydroxybenzoyl)adenylate synthase n=1 Tax=Aeromonas sp. 601027 TaxID=2712036 RepID=UPI003B9E51BF
MKPLVPFTPWPAELAAHYRAQGWWRGQPLTALLDDSAERYPERTALICGERTLSYGQLKREVDALAARLTVRGLGHGDTALVQLPNCAEFYICWFALIRCGVVAVHALYSHQRRELVAFARQIEPALLVLSPSHPGFVGEAGSLAALDERVSPSCQTLLFEQAEGSDLQSGFAWRQPDPIARADGSPLTAIAPTPTPADQVAFFQLSGGSTGTPKLIPRTHDDYGYSVRQSVAVCGWDERVIYLCALPAPHNFPLSSPGALGVFYAGGCVVLAKDPYAATCLPLVQRHQVNWAALVPPALALWLEAASHYPQTSLECVQVGGARLSPAHADAVASRLGCRLQQVFGMAEGLVNYTRIEDDQWHIVNTQGRPMSSGDEVEVRDSDGHPLPDGECGELWTRGPYTFRGYFKADAHNQRAFDRDGFYCTGDLVCRLPGGHLMVVGRNKDQINRGGEKIDALEIEELLITHPDVRQAALVAMPDPMLGERSCAFLMCREPLNLPRLRRFLREQGVADYKLPDRLVLVEQLPHTPVGKIDKQRLREQLAKECA